MDISSLQQQIDFLTDKVDLINQNIQFNINTFLTVLAIALAIAGGAAIVLAKYLFNKRFEEEAKKIDEKIKNYVKENPQIRWARGIGTLIWSKMIEGNKYQSKIVIYTINNISKDLILLSEFNVISGEQKIPITDYEILIVNNQVTVEFIHPNHIGLLINHIEFFMLWQNPIYIEKV